MTIVHLKQFATISILDLSQHCNNTTTIQENDVKLREACVHTLCSVNVVSVELMWVQCIMIQLHGLHHPPCLLCFASTDTSFLVK